MTKARWWLILILLVSAGLRVELARRGGQYYWPDETRYAGIREAVAAWERGDRADFMERMIGTSDHVLFRPIALVPALLERWGGEVGRSRAMPAVFFGLFGVGAIAVVWLIVRRETGDEAAATWGAAFYAGSTGAFLFSRHYFPYDAGLFFLLLGWWVGRGGESLARAWAAGVLVGVGYLVYNAYWNVGAIILVFLTLRAPWSVPLLVRRGVALFLGLVTPVLLVYGLAGLFGYNLFAHARTFAQTVVQGDFGRGWWFLLSYLAVTEGAFVLWLLLVAAAGGWWAGRGAPEARAGLRYLAMGALLALQIILLSDVIPRFAVAGRMIKPIMLFLAMGAGVAAARLLLNRSRRWTIAVGAVTLVLVAVNFVPVVRLVFPPEFRRAAEQVVAREREERSGAALQLYYTGFMHRAKFLPAAPPHDVLLSARHPHQFRPYQFEGYSEPERARFADHDFPMRLIRRKEPGPDDSATVAWAPYPGVVELELRLPEPRPVGRTEPLLVTGETGRGDLLSLQYLDEERVAVVQDHWGFGAWQSAPFVAEGPGPHRVLVSSGALLPPAEHGFMQAHPRLQPLQGRLLVEWNQQLVVRQDLEFFPATMEQFHVGVNAIGGSTAEPAFTGTVTTVRRRDPREMALGSWGVAVPRQSRGDWAGAPGPQRARLAWVAEAGSAGEALLARIERGYDRIELRARWEAQQVWYSLWTDTSWWVPAVRVAEAGPFTHRAGEREIWLSSGLTTPEVDRVPEEQRLRADWLRPRCLVVVDGQVVLDEPLEHRGIDMVETMAGVPPDPVRVTWGAEAGEGTAAPSYDVVETGAVPIEEFAPVAGVVGSRVRGGENLGASGTVYRLRLRLPPGGEAPPEPLLVAGRAGAADGVFVQYVSDSQIRVGHDHWGAELVLSPPFTVRRDAVHEVEIALAPEAEATAGIRQGAVTILWNGEPVLQAEGRRVAVAAPHEFAFGANRIGMGTSVGDFSGEILEVSVEQRR